ncbi:hypothetical protein C8J57DRAFT_1210358 [Mycena rebaudengoi]|nr:hypothetical protein C8J57DRAFT_1210358 [Mycena rebaudengoi]
MTGKYDYAPFYLRVSTGLRTNAVAEPRQEFVYTLSTGDRNAVYSYKSSIFEHIRTIELWSWFQTSETSSKGHALIPHRLIMCRIRGVKAENRLSYPINNGEGRYRARRYFLSVSDHVECDEPSLAHPMDLSSTITRIIWKCALDSNYFGPPPGVLASFGPDPCISKKTRRYSSEGYGNKHTSLKKFNEGCVNVIILLLAAASYGFF